MNSFRSRRFLRRSLMETPVTSRTGIAFMSTGRLPPSSATATVTVIGLALEVGDPLAQDADEITHDVDHRLLHPEEVRVQVALLADPVTNLAGQPGVELILRHGFEHRATRVGLRVFEVHRHVERLRGDGQPCARVPTASSGTARRDRSRALADKRSGRVRRAGVFSAMGSSSVVRSPDRRWARPKLVFNRPLVLIDRVKPAQHVAHDEPRRQTEQDANGDGHQ